MTTKTPMEIDGSSSGAQNAQAQANSQAQFELGTTLSLFFWPSLSLAVTNNWGGADSADKREWFAQQTIDLLNDAPDADAEWLEEFLLNVMLDEFEVNVDDDSGFEVAEQIMRIRKNCAKGDYAEVVGLKQKWDSKGGRGEDVGKLFEKKERKEEDDETSGSEDEDDNGGVDVDMDEAPPLVRVREPVVPEVDDDGFTKVTKKKR